jgi:hypothetical protein
MKYICFLVGLVAPLMIANLSGAESGTATSRTIPLDQVWAYKMPGTKSVRELEPKVILKELSVAEMIRVSRVHRIYNSLKGKHAGPAFVVEGTGTAALKNAEAVFLGADPPAKLKPNVDLTLVFYTVLGGEVAITLVDHKDDRIVITYHFTPEAGMWADFALIPLGKLKTGVVDVEIVNDGEPNRLEDRVSGAFSFEVE